MLLIYTLDIKFQQHMHGVLSFHAVEFNHRLLLRLLNKDKLYIKIYFTKHIIQRLCLSKDIVTIYLI